MMINSMIEYYYLSRYCIDTQKMKLKHPILYRLYLYKIYKEYSHNIDMGYFDMYYIIDAISTLFIISDHDEFNEDGFKYTIEHQDIIFNISKEEEDGKCSRYTIKMIDTKSDIDSSIVIIAKDSMLYDTDTDNPMTLIINKGLYSKAIRLPLISESEWAPSNDALDNRVLINHTFYLLRDLFKYFLDRYRKIVCGNYKSGDTPFRVIQSNDNPKLVDNNIYYPSRKKKSQ